MYRSYTYLLLALTLFIPLSVSAEVISLVPLPTNFGGDTQTLGGYINTIFFLAIGIGASLAVLRIVWGGFQYMTSEAVTNTKGAREIITAAVVGLLLLLGSWLVLYVINPELTNLDALSFENLRPSITPDQLRQINESRNAARASGISDEQKEKAEEYFSQHSEIYYKNVITETEVELAQKNARHCKSTYRTPTVKRTASIKSVCVEEQPGTYSKSTGVTVIHEGSCSANPFDDQETVTRLTCK